MDKEPPPKPLFWIASSRKDLKGFPDDVQDASKLLRSGQVRVDSKRVQANERLEAGAEIRVPKVVRLPPKAGPSLKAPPGVSKGDRDSIERMILFEDDDVMVLNKPMGLAVQGGSGTFKHVDGMLGAFRDRSG
jgi:23S rRNA pseudouridine955/2504/2580 synthase